MLGAAKSELAAAGRRELCLSHPHGVSVIEPGTGGGVPDMDELMGTAHRGARGTRGAATRGGCQGHSCSSPADSTSTASTGLRAATPGGSQSGNSQPGEERTVVSLQKNQL